MYIGLTCVTRSSRTIPSRSLGTREAPSVAQDSVKSTWMVGGPSGSLRSEYREKLAEPFRASMSRKLQPSGSAFMHGTHDAVGTDCAMRMTPLVGTRSSPALQARTSLANEYAFAQPASATGPSVASRNADTRLPRVRLTAAPSAGR